MEEEYRETEGVFLYRDWKNFSAQSWFEKMNVQGRKGNRGSSEKKYRLDGKYEGRNFRPMCKRKGEVKGRVSGQTGKVKERKKVDC